MAESLQLTEEAHGSYSKRIWRVVAFLGRYAHQPVDVLLGLPVDDLIRLSDATGYVLDKEAEAQQKGKSG